ncbi:butyrophilin subfamily 1 member A1-like isoform X2 [Syngnathus acus]|nr:butyrophilin subfamily 1 member A1-like isoform X2 [Syngnathus acus]XP_037122578.1 butyrophilin subfamily 1 member A1-like isoform X2 [Syngnathus acus]XP_037122579.1 butyrophilin subfamily 1 member A1-like isoform X2 [Syngnathus acus]XP_037122580.1 butyrophilin subfamily 1 member A1-like isoform X2 [Syngnathus acus]XP_037122581.1 butyrophilin subfamily 1 member A1-like isoform X2 [Syngnathus acus]XP_037122582.1 butyrophilin subfamily 1 member A1-like isoform X2 [Syngnathus acus]
MVAWYLSSRAPSRLVSRLESGLEQDSFQHRDFKGRGILLTEKIKDGRAILQVSKVRINDSGNYQCVVRRRTGLTIKTLNYLLLHLMKQSQKRFPRR